MVSQFKQHNVKTFNLNKQLVQITISNLNNDIKFK
jgi:hypothetical protein